MPRESERSSGKERLKKKPIFVRLRLMSKKQR
jgi:hypothetical protein